MTAEDDSDTPMVRRALQAMATPTSELTPGQVRLLIGQQVELDRTVPVALALLAGDPLLDVDFYPGDLLVALCRLPAAYWAEHPDEAAEVDRLAARALAIPVEYPEDREVHRDFTAFRRAYANP